MSRRWLRLVSCLCMVAYALTNTHANLAWSQVASSRPNAEHCASTDDGKRSKCKHCAKKGKPGESASKSQRSAQPRPNSTDEPGAPLCPCCPGDPSCPMPGGCSMCSVAKAPCLAETPTAQASEAYVGESSCEIPIAYLSPFLAGDVRPPRA